MSEHKEYRDFDHLTGYMYPEPPEQYDHYQEPYYGYSFEQVQYIEDWQQDPFEYYQGQDPQSLTRMEQYQVVHQAPVPQASALVIHPVIQPIAQVVAPPQVPSQASGALKIKWNTQEEDKLVAAYASGMSFREIQKTVYPNHTSFNLRQRHLKIMRQRGQPDYTHKAPTTNIDRTPRVRSPGRPNCVECGQPSHLHSRCLEHFRKYHRDMEKMQRRRELGHPFEG